MVFWEILEDHLLNTFDASVIAILDFWKLAFKARKEEILSLKIVSLHLDRISFSVVVWSLDFNFSDELLALLWGNEFRIN
jgi:hypothetical protein